MLVLSILLFTQVGIDLLAPGSKPDTRRHFSVLGLHLANWEEWAAQQHSTWWFGVEVSVVVFSIVYAVGSGLLVLACMWRSRRLTIPWLVMSAVSILCQVISLTLRQHTKSYNLNDWEMMIAIWNIIVCLGIWTLVFKTQKRWAGLRRNAAASSVTYSVEDAESSATTPLLGSSEQTAAGSHGALGQRDAPLDNVQDTKLSLDMEPATAGSHQALGQQDAPLDKVKDTTSLESDSAAAESRQVLGQTDTPLDKVQDATLTLDTKPDATGSHQAQGQKDAPVDSVQDAKSSLDDPVVSQVAPAQRTS
ncbi:uncharacterized protein [Anabrus simplex]|uniref:uncharacterized protein isoform X2 n=1 Tax=Anabrus simplex TaxID=316456 RepID=UPI0035A35DC2